MHSGIWIDSVIMRLKRTPAERMLLAAVCCLYAGEGKCELSNKELSCLIDIHKQSVSDLVKKLHDDELLVAVVDKERANTRTLTPRKDLVEPYLRLNLGYKENPDSQPAPYKENPYSPPNGYKENPDRGKEILDSPVKKILIGSKDIPYSTLTSYQQFPYSVGRTLPQLLDYQAAQKKASNVKRWFAGKKRENNIYTVNTSITFSLSLVLLLFARVRFQRR